MDKVIAVIPALNPLNSLIPFVEEVLQMDFEKVIIINDGSDRKYQQVFSELKQIKDCIVIEHPQNFGKGKALKTGFHYVLKYFPYTKGIITMGAYCQHKTTDVSLILHKAKVFSNGIILGVRNFKSKDIPISKYFGNQAASLLFQLLFHKRILDTQTGLRYIPKQELYWLIKVPGNSFSFDTNMLVEAIKRKVPIYEIPIGHLQYKKNSIIQYDEITNMNKVIQQLILLYSKNKS
ncbi:dolichyl-phosphate mannose synthase [Ureibacillus massiliensis 4400831 = CIP 108448 = CCUG 49529]|uniref:Dolichyl-phosphate mannose synthase n=1 Tax=Ureibacillus massiliensis 4400831 = CIP 108448 = CCUG 49529 TaxID=1211035 RepID=A0A0A3J244_9BACL|nr:glycosyltransferase family 2 protein [Ureibacillus massiliensis]KGR89760.1 dolichyl-phosphate mannose synthase [Ureibacillus massiliensis 4400831 = CIP 108448 = CCUG 49529]